jgi:hypothetical protein
MHEILGYDSIHLESSLPPSSFLSKITLVILNRLHITQLMIGYADFKGAWAGRFMPLLQLPTLFILHIAKKTRINTAFVVRHPTLETLTLKHYSLARSDVNQDHGPWAVPSLRSLSAPLPYLHNLVRVLNL